MVFISFCADSFMTTKCTRFQFDCECEDAVKKIGKIIILTYPQLAYQLNVEVTDEKTEKIDPMK